MKRLFLPVLSALTVFGCGQETPTEVGGGLLPPNAVRTFEVILDASQYLVADTAFGLYSEPVDSDFAILANDFGGALDSRFLARYALPGAISVVDSAGVTRTDSVPRYFAGRIVFGVDTVGSSAAPVRLALYRTDERFHAASANWQFRVDTAGVRQPWSTPGGGALVLVDTASLVAGSDSVVLNVDSATMVHWRTHGESSAVIAVVTNDARVRTTLPLLQAQARSTVRPDTTVTVTVHSTQRTFIFQPALEDSARFVRVGGTPAWRTFLRLRERLDTVTVPCPGVPNCRLRLDQVTLNRAALLLQPVPAPPGFAPEAAISIVPHLALRAPEIPLHRTPISGALTTGITVQPSSFTTPDAATIELGITDLIVSALGTPGEGQVLASDFALLPGGARTFGFATFAEMPRLRLVISIAQELQLP